MQITKADVTRRAGIFLGFLDEMGIESNEDLEARIGQSYLLADEIGGEVMINKNRTKQSIPASLSYCVSYVVKGIGIPIELRINPNLNYSHLILKVQKVFDGYEPFSKDNFDNIVQIKVFMGGGNLYPVRGELKALSEREK